MRHHLYIAEDDVTMLGLLSELAQEAGFSVQSFTNGQHAYDALLQNPPDALLADIQMPGLNGVELIESATAACPGLPAAIITGYATVPDVVRAFRAGAVDLITKPFDNLDVRNVLQKISHQLDKEWRIEALNKRLNALENNKVLPVIKSRSMRETMSLVEKVADLDTPVLLTGETGSGKGVIARAIHAGSSRRLAPWFSVNCGALADSVAESELFGHERGAFTGANARKRGILELADGGTLFLDEINSASSAIQTRLLDFVQEHTLRRVGGEKSIQVDVRLIIASNQSLEKLVKEGEFREDLWYRLNVFPVTVPALRDRREDILPLAENFLINIANDLKRPARHFSDEAEDAMLNYSWPGNVRELENFIHRAVVLADDTVIQRKHLPTELTGIKLGLSYATWGPDASLQELEGQWILHMISRCDGNKSEAARRLGVDVSTLHRKLREAR